MKLQKDYRKAKYFFLLIFLLLETMESCLKFLQMNPTIILKTSKRTEIFQKRGIPNIIVVHRSVLNKGT